MRKINIAFLVLVMVTLATLSGCSQAQKPKGPPVADLKHDRPASQGYDMVAAYFTAHPQTVPPGWIRGIIVRTRVEHYACLNGICRTWHGRVVFEDKTEDQLDARQGDNELTDIVSVGDEVLVSTDTDVSSDSLTILQHGAVALN